MQKALGRTDTCVLTTRILLDILRERGFHGAPLPMSVAAYNDIGTTWLETHGSPRHHDHFEELRAAGGWIVTCGFGHEPEGPGWAGHLVCAVDDVLIDATLDQFSRPERGINLAPLVERAPRSLLMGRSSAELNVGRNRVVYEPCADRTYLRSLDWTCVATELLALTRIALEIAA